MPDYAEIERTLVDALHLTRRPVAVAFREAPPQGVERLAGAQPSGCSFWRLASDGQVFYTVPSDHFNCPIGSYTHKIDLPEERQHELVQMLTLMTNIGYVRMEEVPSIPRLSKEPAATIYAPLGLTPVDPNAVLMAGRPGRLMLLHEASTRASRNVLPLLGRPTCAAIPAAMSGGVASSLGCVGNRVYTSISDDEFYTVIAGQDLEPIVAELATMISANTTLAEFHQSRRASISSL